MATANSGIIVALCDFLYPKGILLKSIDFNHAITIVIVVLMTGVVLLGQYNHAKKRVGGLGWDSLSLFFFYITGLIFLYTSTHNLQQLFTARYLDIQMRDTTFPGEAVSSAVQAPFVSE